MPDTSGILKPEGGCDPRELLHREGDRAVLMSSAARDRVEMGQGRRATLASDALTLKPGRSAVEDARKAAQDPALKGLTRAQKRKVAREIARKADAAMAAIGSADAAGEADSLDDAQAEAAARSLARRLGERARQAMAARAAHSAKAAGAAGAISAAPAAAQAAGPGKQPGGPRADTPGEQARTASVRKPAQKLRQKAREARALHAAARAEAAAASTGAMREAGGIASRLKRVKDNTLAGTAAAGASIAGIALIGIMALLAVVLTMLITLTGDEMMRDGGWGLDGLSDNERIVAVYLKQKGVDKVHAAAIMGNISQECGFDTALIENGEAAGVGIFQWPTTTDGAHGNRMKAYVESTGRAWTSLYGQLDYAWYEISGDASTLPGNPGAYAASQWCWNYEPGCTAFLRAHGIPRNPGASYAGFTEQTDISVATEYFCWGFLRPATWAANAEHRIAEAERFLAVFNSGSSIASMVTDPARQAILAAAQSQLGVPYVWGGTTPFVGLDCSGLTQYCYAQAGISIPRVTEDQKAAGSVIPLDQAEPGDILWRQGHVAVFVGDDIYIHAPHTGATVCIASGISSFTCAVRF